MNRRVPSTSPAPDAGLDPAHLGALLGKRSRPLLQLGAGGFGHGGAVAEFLAGALVDDDGDDGGERLALLAGQRGIGERQHGERDGERTEHRAAGAGDQHEQRNEQRHAADRDEPGQAG